jgi:hypothetical protein
VDISSAPIPAVSFVITAIVPARCHPRNDMKPSILHRSFGFPVVAVKSRKRHPSPILIASHSQLEEITLTVLLNGIVE